MTPEQQKIVDSYHERVISLIFKRRRAAKYGSNSQQEYDQITAEIEKIEAERRAYEGNTKSRGPEEPKVEGRLPGEEAGNEFKEAETEVQRENEDVAP
jgi:hypothetical protein